MNYLEGVAAHGRASSGPAFGTILVSVNIRRSLEGPVLLGLFLFLIVLAHPFRYAEALHS